MTVYHLTDDFSYDPHDETWVANGAPWYRIVLPALVTGGIVGRPTFSVKDGFGIHAVSDPEGITEGRFDADTIVLKLLLEKRQLKQVQIAKQLGQRIVVDVDDWFPGIHPSNAAYQGTDPDVDRARNRSWGELIILEADTITVSTPFLHDYYQSLGHRDVRMIRNGIFPPMFAGKERQHSKRRPVIGWVGALSWRSEDLEQLSSWMPDFMQRQRLQFHHSGMIEGHGYAYEKLGLRRRDWCSTYPQVPITRLADLMQFDIGIIPLNNIDFNAAKSFLKGLEYLAAGIPWVASDLPEYRLLAAETGCAVAATDEAWIDAMTALLPYKARVEASERGREVVLASHTIFNRADDWKAVLAG